MLGALEVRAGSVAGECNPQEVFLIVSGFWWRISCGRVMLAVGQGRNRLASAGADPRSREGCIAPFGPFMKRPGHLSGMQAEIWVDPILRQNVLLYPNDFLVCVARELLRDNTRMQHALLRRRG